jgi:hypothetical protein
MNINSNVDHPSHYQGDIECIDAIASALNKDEYIGFLKGNIIKYIWREEKKGHLNDLLKAQWYLDKLCNLLKD